MERWYWRCVRGSVVLFSGSLIGGSCVTIYVRLVPGDRGCTTESVVAEFGSGAVLVVQW